MALYSSSYQSISINRKDEILKASAALFRTKGYAATTMRDIAREMGMEAASLYNHIASKQLILSELLLEIADLFTEGMSHISKLKSSHLEKLEALISLHVDITVKHTDAISLIPNEWVHLQEPKLQEFLLLRDEYERQFKAILAAYLSETKSSNLDIDVALFSILSSLRWLYSWYSKYDQKPIDNLKSELIQSLLYGLK